MIDCIDFTLQVINSFSRTLSIHCDCFDEVANSDEAEQLIDCAVNSVPTIDNMTSSLAELIW